MGKLGESAVIGLHHESIESRMRGVKFKLDTALGIQRYTPIVFKQSVLKVFPLKLFGNNNPDCELTPQGLGAQLGETIARKFELDHYEPDSMVAMQGLIDNLITYGTVLKERAPEKTPDIEADLGTIGVVLWSHITTPTSSYDGKTQHAGQQDRNPFFRLYRAELARLHDPDRR